MNQGKCNNTNFLLKVKSKQTVAQQIATWQLGKIKLFCFEGHFDENIQHILHIYMCRFEFKVGSTKFCDYVMINIYLILEKMIKIQEIN